jgi:hypothetical protein
MSDVVLVAAILAFFSVAALLVRACGRITAGSVEEVPEPAPEVSIPEGGGRM